MDKSKIILRLQQLASTSSNTYELMTLAKAAEKLRAGLVKVVSTTASLPAAATSTVGEIFLVENDDDLYVNVGSQWNSLNNEISARLAYAWGRNTYGRLGDGTETARSSPVTVVGGITNWSQLAAGQTHSLGLTSTGIAYAWGNNGQGRLGDGTLDGRSSPVSVIGGITNWSQVSAGTSHSLGVTSTGIAYAWGYNSNGRLGDGTTTNRSSPVTVIGGITNWSQLSAGLNHSLGLRSNGILYAWGRGAEGRLGDGNATDRSSPVTVVGGITNWSQVSAGDHSLGVTTTGIAYAWGYNGQGRLGDGTTTQRSSPVTVVGGITNWNQVSAALNHSLGLTSTGIAYAWGNGGSGRLGDGTTTSRSSPVTVIGGITNWSQLRAGPGFSLGLTSTGVAYAWGSNNYGQLGNGNTTSTSSPVTVIGGITNWSQVSAGANYSSLGLRPILKSI
jgi:alpha-tubulin suppressor-like RCC1 family protein